MLLRLSGPLQAWGVESRFSVRDTGREPSKSGVIGLLMAAKGWPRGHPVEELARLRLGVRADVEGVVLRDYHVAGVGGYLNARGTIERDNVIPGNRYYLMGARFLVGLEGEDIALLQELHAALRDPVWGLYLGRKACVPGEPVWLCNGLRPNESLEQALRGYPWLRPKWFRPERRPSRLRLVLEDPEGPQVRPDQPLSFAERRFAPRRTRTCYCDAPSIFLEEVDLCTSPA
ncbi:MAG: type I-E CRISPR-associated protein Cas5/CasD [Chloroflexi bacterium]|nr:type I-E CRISPR-associated protein Cas5/CasD [Chloroflexota bacterium]